MVTLTGIVWIPLCLAALALGFRTQIMVLGASAVLSSAAVMNLASFGIQPGYFMALLILGALVAVALPQGAFWLSRAIALRAVPLAILLLASLNALFWANAVFWDDVWVVSGRQMFDLDSAERYSFRAENLNQLVYLLFNIVLVLVVSDRLARLRSSELLPTAHAAVLAPFALATLFVAWDWAANWFGWYFPTAFLHSNAFYAAAHDQSFGAVPRVSGPFSEPSGLAYAYGGFLAYASACYLVDRRARSLFLVLTAVAALAISTSTTAYALLALWSVVALVVLVWRGVLNRKQALPRQRRSRVAVMAVVLFALVGGAWVAQNFRDEIRVIYESAILGKTETGSYQSRTGADRMGLASFAATGGLGLGLGSHRPSTLPVTLLSNTGLIGTLAFVVFIGMCLYRHRGMDGWPADARALWPLRAFTLGLLAGHLVSSPNLNGQLLWLSLILNLAVSVHRPTCASEGSIGPTRSFFSATRGNPC